MNTAVIVQKPRNHCNVLRDDGMSYGDYVKQLTYLLFLISAEYAGKKSGAIPPRFRLRRRSAIARTLRSQARASGG